MIIEDLTIKKAAKKHLINEAFLCNVVVMYGCFWRLYRITTQEYNSLNLFHGPNSSFFAIDIVLLQHFSEKY